jgi:NAD(P)-dependent dehydrogenase (short-subunit alcohol dehydrogenase family)
LERARERLEAEGADVVAIPCDVSNRADVTRLVEQVAYHHGRVDILVNNAGIIQVGPLSAMTEADFEQALGVMFWGVLHTTLTVLPGMRARGRGRIVNITSIGGKVAVPHLLPYTAAKFAAVGLSEGLRAELAPEGITVTTIAPGLMRTGSHVNAEFKGRHREEFRWFSLGASLPVASMDAERAARQIVRALRRGEAERVLSVSATLLAAFHGVFPGLTAEIMTLVNRLILPGESADRAALRGRTIQQEGEPAALTALTTMGRSAARRFLEEPDSVPAQV